MQVVAFYLELSDLQLQTYRLSHATSLFLDTMEVHRLLGEPQP